MFHPLRFASPSLQLFLTSPNKPFSGKIRFSEHCDVVQAIEGPIPNLWLDYSQVTGTLNQMQVAQPGGRANVHLAWEGVNENVEKQFALHQSLDYARRGFLEEPL